MKAAELVAAAERMGYRPHPERPWRPEIAGAELLQYLRVLPPRGNPSRPVEIVDAAGGTVMSAEAATFAFAASAFVLALGAMLVALNANAIARLARDFDRILLDRSGEEGERP